MAVAVKICGLTDAAALAAAVEGGASYLGFVFYPRSPRALTIEPRRAIELRQELRGADDRSRDELREERHVEGEADRV